MGKEGSAKGVYWTIRLYRLLRMVVFNCVQGSTSLQLLCKAGSENLDGKILIDSVNPLEYSTDIWTLTVSNINSLGEQIQREFPGTRVVKSQITTNCNVMVEPDKLSDHSEIFVSGEDTETKAVVITILYY